MKKKFFKEEKRWYRSVGAWARRGSPTMEYIILIAVGALFAGLLYLAMSDGEGLIQSAMEKRVQEILRGRLPEGEVPSGNNSGISGSSDIGNAPEMGNPGAIGANPEIGASPDASIPPELEGLRWIRHDSGGWEPESRRDIPFHHRGRIRECRWKCLRIFIPIGVRGKGRAFRMVGKNEKLRGLRTNPERCRPSRQRDAGFSHIG